MSICADELLTSGGTYGLAGESACPTRRAKTGRISDALHYEVVDLVGEILARCGGELGRGSLVTEKTNKITCHGLPRGKSE